MGEVELMMRARRILPGGDWRPLPQGDLFTFVGGFGIRVSAGRGVSIWANGAECWTPWENAEDWARGHLLNMHAQMTLALGVA